MGKPAIPWEQSRPTSAWHARPSRGRFSRAPPTAHPERREQAEIELLADQPRPSTAAK